MIWRLLKCCNSAAIKLCPATLTILQTKKFIQAVYCQQYSKARLAKGCFSGYRKFKICTIKPYSQSEQATKSVQSKSWGELPRTGLKIQSDEEKNKADWSCTTCSFHVNYWQCTVLGGNPVKEKGKCNFGLQSLGKQSSSCCKIIHFPDGEIELRWSVICLLLS